MRRTLNAPLLTGDAEFRLDRESVTSDIDEFLWSEKEPARLSALYTGPFLDGFHLSHAIEFGHWVDRERDRTTAMACAAAETLAHESSAKGDHAAASGMWRKRVAMSPLDAAPTMGLMEELALTGDRAGAVQHARRYEKLVRTEVEMEPDSGVTALAERLRRDAPTSSRSPPGSP
jgi:DNA-binding SARP family transcriptional activator